VSNVDLLSPDWYVQDDVVQLARELIGKELFTIVNGQFTSGIITETEAYNGLSCLRKQKNLQN
jgi:DNA-3-methyladenine glycosylase